MIKTKKTTAFLLSLLMIVSFVLSYSGLTMKATASTNTNLNLALKKPTLCSGVEVEGYNLESASAVDGDKGTRWSSDKNILSQPVWIAVNFEKPTKFQQLNIYWQTANAKDYDIEISNDGEKWNRILNVNNNSIKAEDYVQKIAFDEPVVAQYVRIVGYEGNYADYGAMPSISIYEIEVYEQPDETTPEIPKSDIPMPPTDITPEVTVEYPDIVGKLKGKAPTISEDGKKVILPKIDGYNVSLYGSDNKQVIDLDGNIYRPLNDTNVRLMYKTQSHASPEFVQEGGDFNVTIKIPGTHQKKEGDNPMPDVLPSLREWKGYTGEMKLTADSKIVIADAQYNDLLEKAQQIKYFFKEMLKRDIEIVKGTPKAGDIYLVMDKSISHLGGEGYYLEINDYVTIKAPELIGVLYGGVTVTQILYQAENYDTLPKGIARDYPKYEVRSGMLDVGRAWIPLNYVEEITKYMAWYKMNEVHLHINESGANDYHRFRLESNVKGLNTPGEFYTKEEYKAYQKEVLKYGIEVLTEIDTPAHSGCFANLEDGPIMKDPINIDIRRKESLEFVKNLLDEYITGEDPVIINKKVHIGGDEYPKRYSEEMRYWINSLITHVKSRGFEARIWGSFGNDGFNGLTPVRGDAEANYWAVELSDWKTLYEMGYDIINTCGPILYTVPGGNYAFADYLDLDSLYRNWEVNYFTLLGTEKMPLGHPQTKGASFALWNDTHTEWGGFTKEDIYARVKNGVAIIAEKTWKGEKTEGQTKDNYLERVEKLGNRAPGANPERYIESETDIIANYDFEKVSDNVVTDKSGNEYNATIKNAAIKEDNGSKVLSLNGNSSMSMPMATVGFPYSVEFDLKLDSNNDPNATLFAGEGGSIYTNIDGTGKIGFKKEGYTFIYDYKMPINEWVNIKIACDEKDAFLIINDEYSFKGKNQIQTNRDQSTTVVLSTKTIGDKIKGSLDNLKVQKSSMLDELTVNKNLALGCDVKVSGHEFKDGRLEGRFAVDGRSQYTSSVALSKNDPYQWMTIDLGSVQDINKVIIEYYYNAKEYEVLVSETGKNGTWKRVYSTTNAPAGKEVTNVIKFPTKKARYVKYVQRERWTDDIYNQSFSGLIMEFEVYNYNDTQYKDSIDVAKKLLKKGENVSAGESEKAKLNNSIKAIESYLDSTRIFEKRINNLKLALEADAINYAKALGEIVKVEITNKVSEMSFGDELLIDIAVKPENVNKPDIKFTSSNEKVIKVDETEKINAVGLGNATITAAVSDTLKDSVTINVTMPEIIATMEGATVETSTEEINIDLGDKKDTIKLNVNNDYKLYADPEGKFEIKGNVNLTEQIIKVYAKKGNFAMPIVINSPSVEYKFSDIKDDHWYIPFVERATSKGFIKGKAFNEATGMYTLEPFKNATRAEAITFALRMLGTDVKQFSDVKIDFVDYEEGKWCDDYIKAAYALGITKGSADPSGLAIRAFDTISRQEFFSFFARVAQITDKNDDYKDISLDQFADVKDIADWAVNDIKYLVYNKIVEGDQYKKINPKDNIKRAEIIKVIACTVK